VGDSSFGKYVKALVERTKQVVSDRKARNPCMKIDVDVSEIQRDERNLEVALRELVRMICLL
jgi:hypothetical protein